MQHVRLAGVVVILLAALAGGHAANATTLCGSSTAPCPSANVVPSGTPITLEAVKGILAAGEEVRVWPYIAGSPAAAFTCATGTENSTTASTEEGLYGAGVAGASPATPSVSWQVTALRVTRCGQGCTVTLRNFPWNGTITAPASVTGPDYSFTLTVPVGVAGSRSVTLTCPGEPWSPCDLGGTTINGQGYNPLNPNRPDLTGPDAGHGQLQLALGYLPRQAGNCSNAILSMNLAIYRGTTLNDLPGDLWVR